MGRQALRGLCLLALVGVVGCDDDGDNKPAGDAGGVVPDGGVAQGDWSKKENRWYVKKKGTTADGRRASATNIITCVDNDAFTLQSTQRTVAGHLLPNIDEVMVACPRAMIGTLPPVIHECALIGVPVTLLSDLFGDMLPPPRVGRFGSRSVRA